MRNIKILFFLLPYLLQAQGNLIHNASFEITDNGHSGASPCKFGQAGMSEVWETDAFFSARNTAWFNVPCSYENCDDNNQICNCVEDCMFHSPDWFKNSNSHTHIYESNSVLPPPNGFLNVYNIPARTGNAYVGMFPKEIVEQQFFNSNPIEEGKTYVFSAYIRIPRPRDPNHGQLLNGRQRAHTSGCIPSGASEVNYGLTSNSEIVLDILLSTQKIKYSDSPFLICSNESGNTKDLTNNHITKLHSFSINTNDYPIHSWHRISFEFECPSGYNYDWIGLEVNDTETDIENSYLLIDDVSLVNKCELGCTATSGAMSPIIATYFPIGPKYAGAIFTNLENIESVSWKVYDMLGQLIYTTPQAYTNNNGFSTPLYWYGMTSAGSPAAIANYVIKLTCTNSCDTKEFSGTIYNSSNNSQNYPSEVNPLFTVNSPHIDYSDCCELGITLSNKTYGIAPDFSPNIWHYRPRNNLHMNSCAVQSNHSKMELIAGNSIEILMTSVESGTNEFAAWIEPCADANRQVSGGGDESIEEDPDDSSQKPNSSTERIEKEIHIAPNPSSDGKFELLNINDPNGVRIKIYSFTGTVIKEISDSKFINLSSFNKGVYIVEVISENKHFNEKIIYQ